MTDHRELTQAEFDRLEGEIRELRAKCYDYETVHVPELQLSLKEANKRIEMLEAGHTAVLELMLTTTGVCGLHLNGDIAPWAELRTGGRFEEWLLPFDDALLEQTP